MRLHDLLRVHGAAIGFGFTLALLSSFGQTFFISLSVPDLQAAHGLSHGALGLVFSAATLASGLLLGWVGAAVDRMTLQNYALVALLGLSVAAVGLTLAPNVWTLALALFGLRLTGQGMLAHASLTSTARLPGGVRGRAIGIATLGGPAGAALLPVVGIAVIALGDWILLWRLSAFVALLCAAAVLFVHRLDPGAAEQPPIEIAVATYSRLGLFRDRRFLALVPTMMAFPAVLSGFSFHQRHLGSELGWSLEVLALALTLSAGVSVAASLLAGALVDRLGALALAKLVLLPLAIGSLMLPVATGSAGALILFALMGLTGGAAWVVMTAALAETYGPSQLGMIRGVAGSVTVVASATTPGLMGWVLDLDLGLVPIGAASAAFLIASALILTLAHRR